MITKEVQNIYFIGIGGIGMSALARYFVRQGKYVSGYDKTPTLITKELSVLNVNVYFEEDVDRISSSNIAPRNTLVVYTPAIPKEHKELVYFSDNGFNVVKRAEVLGEITKNSFSLAVAGTHGKTTTSSILGHIMSSQNATSFLGGIAENYNSNLILGGSEISVVEADEFDRSFLQLSPNIACITSMDADHLDIYGEHNALVESFKAFANKVTDQMIVAKGLPVKGLTYAFNEEADYVGQNVRITNGHYEFDIRTPKSVVTDVHFSLPGRHNMMNAIAAFAMADCYGVDHEMIKKQLQSFAGVQRRFSYRIKRDDFVLIDDYAHHPTEINAVYQSVRELYPNEKVMAIFQPHLFSRTKDFIDDFAKSLEQFDQVALLDIYPARELPIVGVTATWLLEKINNPNKKLITKEEVKQGILDSKCKIVAMLGAGDIGVLIQEVSQELKMDYGKN